MSGDHDVISEKIKAVILFVVWGLADENTTGGMRSKLMQGCHGQVGVAGTPKDPKLLVGRRCVVEELLNSHSLSHWTLLTLRSNLVLTKEKN
jgi:hypothetical protein